MGRTLKQGDRRLTEFSAQADLSSPPPVAAPAAAPLGNYKPSGRFNIVNTVTALVIGLAGALALGLVEGAAALYSPLVYLTILIPVGLGFAIGWLSSVLLRWSRVRNALVPVPFTVVLALAALYAAWALWLVLILPAEALEGLTVPEAVWLMAIHPHSMWDLASHLAEEGVWTIGRSDTPVSGPLLVGCWLAEAAIVLGIAVVFANRQMRSLPFCEECLQWAKPRHGAARLGAGDSAALAQRLERGDLAAFEELGPADLALSRRHVVDLYRCPVCRSFNTLRVDDLVLTVNKEGKLQEHRRPVVRDLLLSREQADWVEQMGQRVGVVDSETEASAAGGEETHVQDGGDVNGGDGGGGGGGKRGGGGD